jgi:hypothetical protein
MKPNLLYIVALSLAGARAAPLQALTRNVCDDELDIRQLQDSLPTLMGATPSFDPSHCALVRRGDSESSQIRAHGKSTWKEEYKVNRRNKQASEDPEKKAKRWMDAYAIRRTKLLAADPKTLEDIKIRNRDAARRYQERKRQGLASTNPLVTDPVGSPIQEVASDGAREDASHTVPQHPAGHDAASFVTQGATQIASQHHEPVHHRATDFLSLGFHRLPQLNPDDLTDL